MTQLEARPDHVLVRTLPCSAGLWVRGASPQDIQGLLRDSGVAARLTGHRSPVRLRVFPRGPVGYAGDPDFTRVRLVRPEVGYTTRFLIPFDAAVDTADLAAEAQHLLGGPVAIAVANAYLPHAQAFEPAFVLQAEPGMEEAVQATVAGDITIRVAGRVLQALDFTTTEAAIRPRLRGGTRAVTPIRRRSSARSGPRPSWATSPRWSKPARRRASRWASPGASP